MAFTEFDLIARYFSDCGSRRPDVALAVGDDCALLQPPAGMQLAVTQDTLVEGVHFFADVDPASLGHKVLAVNLSDLAAMGADAAWVTLGLTLPCIDQSWLEGFSVGFSALARDAGVRLVGGDTTRGPLSMSVTAIGLVPRGAAFRRDAAEPGHRIWVSGTLGDAGLALKMLQASPAQMPPDGLRRRLERPQPRLALARSLRGVASAAIDVSDGLLGDLGHILEASHVGARVYQQAIPCSESVRDYLHRTDDWSVPLGAGDDYELCFTVAPDQQGEMQRLSTQSPCAVHCIGEITSTPGLHIVRPDGRPYTFTQGGYDHFHEPTH